jgi:hypothetical protein
MLGLTNMITIRRDGGYADKLRSYQIVIDGKTVASIRDGEEEKIKVDHEIYAEISWARSNKIKFNYHDGDEISFNCKSNIRGAKIFLGIFYATIFSHRYLNLKMS